MFEQTDIATGYWHPYIQVRQKVIEPVGAAKPETEIFYLLARKIELLSKQAHELWGVNSLPEFLPPQESMSFESISNPPYPFYLLTPNTKNRIHSQFNNLATIRQFSNAPFAQMNPADAYNRGIADGDRIKIYNERGSFIVDALLDMAIRAGCVCVHNGWWLSEGGGVNLSSLGRETDMGYGAAFHDNLVQIPRAIQ
jgi:anaerobic selenocysteine-containing dehydrogenase